MRNHWLHFIGRSYYTQTTFIREALTLGVSRKVNPRMLGGFNWGDRIYLAQGDMAKRNRKAPFSGSEVLGYFTLTQIGGLSPEAFAGYPGIVEELISGFSRIERGCGTYEVVGTYQVKGSIEDLAKYLRESDLVDQVLLQGPIFPFSEPIKLPELGFRVGFQRVQDLEKLAEEGDGTIVGPITSDWSEPDEYDLRTFVEVIKNYTAAEMYSKPEFYDDYIAEEARRG